MTDTRTPEQRRFIMRSVKQANTGPEIAVRKLLHASGHRYRLHARELPGRPDIVFRPKKKAIFVHGCFWHGHNCAKGRPPKSKRRYWGPKLLQNKKRDRRNAASLRALGWSVLVVWQCETRNISRLSERLSAFVDT